MAKGYPDWHRGVKADIIAQTISELGTNILMVAAEYVEMGDIETQLNAPPNTAMSFTLRANPGYIIDITAISMYIPPPSGATSGTHSLIIRPEYADVRLAEAKSNYNTAIWLDGNVWRTADVFKHPPSDSAQAVNLRDLRIVSTKGIMFVYTNNTNATQNTTVYLRIYGKSKKVG